MIDAISSTEALIAHCVANPGRLMWFLGAGASRTAGMPTATDLLWELKLRLYCNSENQDIQATDLSNRSIRDRIQSYFDSKGFPAANDAKEYSEYFLASFDGDLGAQQQFLKHELAADRISLNIGHRILAALSGMGVAQVVFTTNFDEVLERAYAEVTKKNIAPFHLEGSYAALSALNSDDFPLYAKLHGDFKYQSLKNLPADLMSNDASIQQCFLAAANRFGMIISGYSGRDKNVIDMFRTALNQSNPFPFGIFWTVPSLTSVEEAAQSFVDEARTKGVNATIVETGTFDVVMTRLWRQLPNRPPHLESAIRRTTNAPVSVPLPPAGSRLPLLRTNSLRIVELPKSFGTLRSSDPLTWSHLRTTRTEASVFTLEKGIIFWGSADEIESLLPEGLSREISTAHFDDPFATVSEFTHLRAFYEHALVHALCAAKPVLIRKQGRTFFAVASNRPEDFVGLEELAKATSRDGVPGPVSGQLKGCEWKWAEAVSLRLEARGGNIWLQLKPDIWISPMRERENATHFLSNRKIKRWNAQADSILDAWIKLLAPDVDGDKLVTTTAFSDSKHPARFKLSSRSAFSLGSRL